MDLKWQNYINGAWEPPTSGQYLTEYDPRLALPSFQIARSDADDVDLAVATAKTAFGGWKDFRPAERGRILHRLAQSIRDNVPQLLNIDQHETGRPAWLIRSEIETAAQYFEYYGGLVNLYRGNVVDIGPNFHAYVSYDPLGVIGIILPWNAPLAQAARGMAPALATGNTVVVKPSEFASVTSLYIAQLATQAGLPNGVLNVVTGTGLQAGIQISRNADIRKIFFTGSVRTGRDVAKLAAERLIPSGLELGGKSANIVFADADLDKAVAGTIKAFTFNTGQICSAGTRCLVEESVYGVFIDKLKAALGDITIGAEDDAMMGPIITKGQYEKVLEYLDVAALEGAEVFQCGKRSSSADQGWFVMPTVLTGVDNTMRIAREEIFGPVVSVMPFTSERQAVALANDSDYGLVAGLWTGDVGRAHSVAGLLEVGQVFVNDYFSGGVEMPFGGVKNSGYGREKGIEALHHYSQSKSVMIKL